MRRALLELLIPSVCPACDRARPEGQPLLCAPCGAGLEGWPAIAGIRTAVAYRGVGRTLLHRFKFEGRRDALEVLLEPLAARVREVACDAVVPVPRHASRIRSEGSDPAHTLARQLARRLGRPLLPGALERRFATRPQSELGPEARRRNVAGSFAARCSLHGRRVLLVDDIATTGATLEAAARTLREEARAGDVVCAALAGTPPTPRIYPMDPGMRYKARTLGGTEEPPVADTIRIKDSTSLKHQANLGEDVQEVDFEGGAELQVLHTFQAAWLVKDDEGRLFNVKKELAEEA